MIDLEAVVSLRAVATGGSVSAAASTLGFTPSAVSQQIKRLDREVGVRREGGLPPEAVPRPTDRA